jgi:predicted Zn-dependent protease
MMAARARVLAVPGVDALRAMLAEAQRRTDPPATAAARIRDAGVLYGGALAAAQLRDFAGARSLWRQLPPLTEGVVRARQAVELLGIEIDLLAGVVPPSAATADLAQATTRAEVLTVSRSLTAARRGREVSDRLQTWVTAHPGDAMAWQMLAVAYGQQNQTVRAIRADAESRVAQRDYPAALDRFKAAQAMMRSQPGSADHVEGSIIDARARQVESLVKAQALEDKVNR